MSVTFKLLTTTIKLNSKLNFAMETATWFVHLTIIKRIFSVANLYCTGEPAVTLAALQSNGSRHLDRPELVNLVSIIESHALVSDCHD